MVVAAVDTIQAVVAGHDRPRSRLTDRRLERHQVDLAQRALIDVGAHRVPLVLGIVADEVFDGCPDPDPLHAGDVPDGDLRREMGIFGIAFEVAPIQGVAVDVDGWRQQHRGPLAPCLLGDRCADPGHEGGVPGRTEADAGGEAGGAEAAREAAAAARAIWAVGDPDRRHVCPGHRDGLPHARAGKEIGALGLTQLVQDGLEPDFVDVGRTHSRNLHRLWGASPLNGICGQYHGR